MKEQQEAEKALEDSFERWEHLKEHGGSDPSWTDGVNMNLVRNHIIWEKARLEELGYFPPVYYRETPPEMDRGYMARAEEIRAHARQALETYKNSGDYQYIRQNLHKLTDKQRKQVCARNILNYAAGLEGDIKSDDLVVMRRHERPEGYLESFRTCRRHMEEIFSQKPKEKQGQMDIFDFI